MSNNFRLSSGGQINRTERISFKFNGKYYFQPKSTSLNQISVGCFDLTI